MTLYGGYLEQYIKTFANVPSVAASSSETAFKVSSIAKSLFSKMGLMQSPSLPHGMDLSGAGALSLQKFSKDYIDSKMKQSKNETSTGPDIDSKIQLALQRKSQEKLENLKASNREENFQDYIVSKLFSSKRIADAVSSGRQNVTGSKTNQEVVWSKDAGQNLSQEYLHNISNGSTICMDRTFSDMAPGWIQGLGGKKGDYREVLRSLIKELSIHEVGHFLGLGHNFKENILPERGSVPEAIYESLAKKATYEEGYTQYSTVMGYRHPRSEMRTTYDEVKPGPSDRLVLAYLYTQKYSTFKTGDADFTFLDIPKDGVIPPLDVNSSGPKTSYFPQCNDITATFSLDPYCNRFDRGHNATEIVDHYFSDIGDNLEQSHFAFTDSKGGSPELNEARLWDRNLAAMGRIRMFYDFMRKTYRNEIDSISQDEAALYEFSSACKSGQSSNEKLIKMFAAKPELKELCIVNSNVVEQIRNLATKNLSEYTKIDSSTAYIPAGIKAGDVDSDYSHAFGSWSQLGSAPLKIPAIYALMAPAPWVRLSPRSNPLSTVATYQREDSGFSYSSLYPFEYTSAIAYAVRDNLKFSNLNGQDSGNQLGRVILALGGLGASVSNNERHIFRKHYLDNIKAQSEFSFSMVAILIEGIGAAKDPLNYVDRFQGYATDIYANKMSINEIYLLPNRQLIAQANDMFLYPISKLELLDDRHLLAFAYKLSYSHEFGDLLNSISVKNQFQVMHDQVMKSCLDGKDKNGVAQYFKNGNPEFQGFLMLPGLFASSASQDKFDASVKTSFDKYYKDAHTDSRVCDEAVGGLGLIISSAAIINGGWLPEAKYYLLNTF